MSYQDGWAAVNLDMPPRVPRIEFDAQFHWDLVRVVTGMDVFLSSSDAIKKKASSAFKKTWNYDLNLMPLIGDEELDARRTSMGHSEYAAGGEDYSAQLYCPFEDPEEVFTFDPWECYGRKDRSQLIRRFNEHLREQYEDDPDLVNTTGTYVTLFSGFISIFGWDMMLTAGGIDPDRFGEVANRYAGWMQQFYDALAESDARVIYAHDDIVWASGAVFHPDWYRKYIFPNYKKLYAPVLESGKKVIFIADGNYTEFVHDVAKTGASGFFFEPLTDLKHVVEFYGKTHVIIGNADTRILLYGTKDEIRAEVERCMNLGRHCPGYFMAVSNMIPSNTPVESALYYNEIYQQLSRR